MWETTAPGTESPHIVCAWIGPPQLGFVLVLSKTTISYHVLFEKLNISRYLDRYEQLPPRPELVSPDGVCCVQLPVMVCHLLHHLAHSCSCIDR